MQIKMLLLTACVFFIAPYPTLMAQSTTIVEEEMQISSPSEVGMSAEKLAQVVPALQQFVDDEVIAGAIVMVARHGKVVLHEAVGQKDDAAAEPMETDSILRFYSMTKPITSVAVMMLVEEGKIGLDDPVSKFVPQFSGLRVLSEQVGEELKTVDAEREMKIRDLLRHTSGLTYGFFGDSPIDKAYLRDAVLDDSTTLEEMTSKLAKLPLLYQPGTRFNYSVSTDLLGHVIEVVSGQGLDEFFKQRIFIPLDMRDTGFYVPSESVDRFTNNYGPALLGGTLSVIDAASNSKYLKPRPLLSGGGGLVSTSRDYMRFCQMLLNKGKLGEARLLRASTVQAMTKNQLPEGAYPISLGGVREGVGFGFGFSVVMEITPWTQYCRVGEYGWGGAASTHFWISPNDDLSVVVLTQYMPFNFRLESAVKPLVYDAIED